MAAVLTKPLRGRRITSISERGALLVHRTRASELMMAAAMDHDVEVPGRVEVDTDAGEDWARTTVICGLRPGQTAAHRQVPGLRLVEPAVAARAARPGRRRR